MAKHLQLGAKDKAIYLWDIPTNRHITTLKHEYEVSKLEFSPDGKILASGDSSAKYICGNLPPDGTSLHTKDMEIILAD